MSVTEFCKNIPIEVWTEFIIRIGLFAIFLVTERLSPFIRVIQPEEFWLYKFPASSSSIVSSQTLTVSYIVSHVLTPWIMISSCLAVILISYGFHRDMKLGLSSLLVPTMAIPLTGIITNILKITIGRPRPDYFSRCYGSNYMNQMDLKSPCTGDRNRILDGRKSFPSGHSSLSFCVLGFLSLYLASQLKTFAKLGPGRSWRLLLTIIPLLLATLVAISRTCDYHHHWQDVVAGSTLGFLIMYTVYRQYYPSLSSTDCGTPYPLIVKNQEFPEHVELESTSSGDNV